MTCAQTIADTLSVMPTAIQSLSQADIFGTRPCCGSWDKLFMRWGAVKAYNLIEAQVAKSAADESLQSCICQYLKP